MAAIIKKKKNKKDSATILSEPEFQYLFGGLSYTGEQINYHKISHMINIYINYKQM